MKGVNTSVDFVAERLTREGIKVLSTEPITSEFDGEIRLEKDVLITLGHSYAYVTQIIGGKFEMQPDSLTLDELVLKVKELQK